MAYSQRRNMTDRSGHKPYAICHLLFAALLAGCSQDMQEQASYQPEEAPRLHSPDGSVPRMSRQRNGTAALDGARLFAINCAHCHGTTADGDGRVAPYLKEQPKNLHAPAIHRLTEEALYAVVTNGKDAMPAFNLLLTPAERHAVVQYVKSLQPATSMPN
jgi:mono/diheme cytochrome c family protein